MAVTHPRPFPGTPAEAEANYNTHHFGSEGRCWNCDCRPWGYWAQWPCGINPDEVGYVTTDNTNITEAYVTAAAVYSTIMAELENAF